MLSLVRSLNRSLLPALLLLALLAGSRAASAADYVIAPEDVLAVKVTGEPQLSMNYPVDEQGYVVVENVGKVRVAGLTAKQTQEKLHSELSKYLKLFEVTVTVVGENGNRVLVYGEVAKTGSVKLKPGGKLLDALAEAGQPTVNADTKRISIARRDGKTETVDLDSVLKDSKLNIELTPGDTITVPAKTSRSVRVEGEVQAPGLKPLEEAKTAYAAVRAANPTAKADWERVVLRRKDDESPRILNLARVREGDLKADTELREGDQITVMSRFTGNVLVKGEVKTPGEKELNGETHLWDFIQEAAGGLTEKADRRRVRVIREKDGKKQTLTFDLIAVSEGRKSSDDAEMEIMPGDSVFVPTGVATVGGEVKSPGDNKPIGSAANVLDFIMSQGGGFGEKADRTKVQIIRDGKVVKTLNLTEVASGQKMSDHPDLEIMPGDRIFVPNDDLSRFVIVGGVKTPGSYPVTPGMTLLDAIAAAGNFSERADDKQFVVAPGDRFDAQGQLKAAAAGGKAGKNGDPEALGLKVIDFKKLKKGDPKQNLAINPGDRILIPEKPPASAGPRRPSFLENILRLVPFAGMLMGGGIGLGGGGFGGYGY